MRFIGNDAYDVTKRKVVRIELGVDKDTLLIDLPKRFAGDGATRFTEPVSERRLDKDEAILLLAWLTEVIEEME